MDDHYRRNHHRKPHEYLVNSVNPLSQQKPYEKNETAYIFLYIALAVGALFLAAMAYGVYRDHKTKSRARNEEKAEKKRRLAKKNIFPDVKPLHGGSSSGKSRSSSNNLYTTGTTSTGGSVPSMSTIAEEVQPPSQDIPAYPNLASYTTTPVNQQNHPRPPSSSSSRRQSNPPPPPTSSSSASYPDLSTENHHHHQQQNSATESSNNLDASGFQYFSTAATATATAPPSSDNRPPLPTTPPPPSSSSNTRRQSRHLSREESFPYEKYDIPLDQREPRTTRVENMRPISDFFKLTAGDSFYRMEEEDEQEGQTSSSSSSSSARSGSEEQQQQQSGAQGGGGSEERDRFSDAATLPYDKVNKGNNPNNDFP